MAVGVVVAWGLLSLWVESASLWTRQDLRILAAVESWRTTALTNVAESLHALGSIWTIRPLRWAAIAAAIGFRHWRQLFAYLGSILIVESVTTRMLSAIGRPRPIGIDIIGDWQGFAHPSHPTAALAVTLAGIAMTFLPQGRWRTRALWLAGAIAGALGSARIYLGVDHPTDVVVAMLVAFAVVILVFRLYAPEAVYPVVYYTGKTAHLPMTPSRVTAIKHAVRDQLGIEVLDVHPVGLMGSGGSTPLKLSVAGEPPQHLFGKLYSRTHQRADRWYKIGRTILYGALEDEVPYSSVRRLVEYEDYILRFMQDEELPAPQPLGIVEITSEREYVVVTTFLEGAAELGDVEITEAIATSALGVVRRMWVCGVAHRDIKPSNLMVIGDKVHLIDVAFTTIRPSPWRQAVDLANMLLILSLRMPPEQVYEIAQRHFNPTDMAEAFAATRGVTIPAQLKDELKAYRKRTGVDLVQRWEEMTPHSDPIAIQRWSLNRIAVTARVLLIALIVAVIAIDNLLGGGFI